MQHGCPDRERIDRYLVGVADAESVPDAVNEASNSSRRRVMSSTGRRSVLNGAAKGKWYFAQPLEKNLKLTFAKHLFCDIVEFALELVEELVDRRGELALGIGVLELVKC
jgi:hypothetical protein